MRTSSIYIYTFTTDPPQPLFPCVHCVQLRNKFYRQVLKKETDVQASAVSVWFLQSIFMVRKPTCSPDRILHVPLGFFGPKPPGISAKNRWHEIFSACAFFQAMIRYDLAAESFRLTKDLFQSSVQNGAFDTLVIESIYASHRAIVASLYHGCTVVAKRYMYRLV